MTNFDAERHTAEEFAEMQQVKLDSKTFICEYRYQGETWGFHLQATSLKEAQERLAVISQGSVLGELCAIVPYELKGFVPAGVWCLNQWERVYTWLTNLFAAFGKQSNKNKD